MGLVTYLGSNVPLEELQKMTQGAIHFTEQTSDRLARTTVQHHHLQTHYIYEIELNGQLDDLNPQSKIETPVHYEQARIALQQLHTALKKVITTGDIAEVYICWFGDEEEDALGEVTLSLQEDDLPEVHTEERYLIRFKA